MKLVDFFRISGEIKNGSEQMAFNFYALLKEILLQWCMVFIDNEILKEFGIACSNVYVFYKATKKNILLVTLKNVFQIYGLMDLAKNGQGLRFMSMTYFVICKKVGVWES